MTVTFSGRAEALIRVPAGGATVSASNGALTSAVTVTVPAGDFYLTEAGGVDSLVDTLETKLNLAVNGYPRSAAAMQVAVGDGTWSAGWTFDILGGNDTGAFGGVTMTASSSPTYGTWGPRHVDGTGDYAVGFDSASDAFSAGDNFDATATDDLVIAWVGYFTSATGLLDLIGKWSGAGAGYLLYENSGAIEFAVRDGVDQVNATVSFPTVATWHVGIAVLDRTNNLARVGVCPVGGSPTVGSSASTAAVGTLANASSFTVGAGGVFGAPTNFYCSGLYVGTGVGAAGSLVANLSSALTSFAGAINDAWTVSLSTTDGRITASGSFWPRSISFTSTALRDVLGFEGDFDYPQTAAQMAAAVGYGTWTSGAAWLCNETSGDLAPAFGSVTLADSGTPTYSNLGARGGSDKAVGASATTDYFDGGDNFDVGASDDLIVVWVGKIASTVSAAGRTLFSKRDTPGWTVETLTTGALQFVLYDGTDSSFAQTATTGQLAGEWHVGIAVLDRGASVSRMGVIGLRSGTSVVSSTQSSTAIGDCSHAVGVRIGGYTGWPTEFQCAYLAVVTGSGVATGLSANLSTALSNFATYMKSQTGTEQSEAVWFPDCPLSLEGDPSQAPPVTDARATRGPTGNVLRLAGNRMYRHRGITWTHVPRNRVWESAVDYANGSWERFVTNMLGFGHEWLGQSPLMNIYWNDAGTDRALGYTFNSSTGVNGWAPLNLEGVEPRPSQAGWTGLFRIELGDVVSSGT